MTRSYKSILDSSRVADTDKLTSSLKEIASKIKDIRDNPDKYVDEIKQEFQESIEKEKLKLETIVKSIEQEEKDGSIIQKNKEYC